MGKRILSLALAIAMVMTLLPATAYAAPGDAMSLDAEDSFGITGGGTNWIYFGESGGDPVKWRVLSTHGNGGTYSDGAVAVTDPLFLISEYMFNVPVPFDVEYYTGTWQGSEVQLWCQNFAASTSNFSSAERAAIAGTTKTDGTYTSTTTINFTSSGSILNGDKLFFLSAEEAESAEYGFSDNADRVAETTSGSIRAWWTRSKFADTNYNFGYVQTDGTLYRRPSDTGSYCRPAFNLNPDDVLFSSSAIGGKVSGTIGDNALTAVSGTAPTEWKLTLSDNSRSFSVHAAGLEVALSPGDTIDTDYYDATSGVNEYISAMITDAADNILYYGRLKAVAGGEENGQIGISIPAGIADGEYTLRIFSEQCNGDKKTDYAGAFQDVSVTIDTTAPVVTSVTPGAGAPVNGSIVITLDDRIGPIGTVSLDGGATFLTGGILSGKVYTIPYSGLSYNTEYTVTISGFGNEVSLPMVSDYTHTFTTKSKSRPYYKIEATTGAGVSTNDDAVNPFADISQDDWFHESVIYVYKNGLMTGTGNDSFRPEGDMSRGMIVTVLYRLSGGTGSYVNNFSDIPSGSWYENAAAWAADNGVVYGVGDKRFAPEKMLTREQLAVILFNYAKYRGLNIAGTDDTALNGFSDTNSISSWAEEAMKWAVSAGIITGNGSQLNPQNSASRAEVAVMLQRFIERVL